LIVPADSFAGDDARIHAGRRPRTKGVRYPADPPKVEEIVAISARPATHQLRHAHVVEMARDGVPLIVIQRQLGHSNLGITSPRSS
jgi:integrase